MCLNTVPIVKVISQGLRKAQFTAYQSDRVIKRTISKYCGFQRDKYYSQVENVQVAIPENCALLRKIQKTKLWLRCYMPEA